jgi:alkylation response protein AidB-like acyl-CoA dehydrogenase
MELDFDPDQEALRDSVRAVLDAECPITSVRSVVEARVAGATASTAELDRRTRELGWSALAIPESAGGLGLGAVEVGLMAEELGRALAPGALLATVTQYVPAVLELADPTQIDRLLAPVAAGSSGGTLAVAEADGSTDPAATTVVAAPDGDGYRLTGSKAFVVEPEPGGSVVVAARRPGTTGDDGVVAVAVPVDALSVDVLDAVDPTRRLATVAFADVAVDADSVLGTPGPPTATGLRRAVEVATVGIALDAVGAAQALFDLSLDYVKQREQFGVPVGSFQAIKHKFADLAILVERARALGYFAALTIAEDDDRRGSATAMAKAAAGDAAVRVAKEGIQTHGGIGYTWESDVHLYVRRLESDAVLFGTPGHHRSVVADLLGV